jgi:regulator of sigma E protease
VPFDVVTLLIAILAIGFLIIVHEAGHYIVARWCNMRVDRFSLGFGPAIFTRRRGETDFTIGPIPFGGFVQINGMLIAEEVDPDDQRAYPNRPVWQRFLTIFAGPATNYLAAIAIAFIVYLGFGVRTGDAWQTVGAITDGSDATGKLEIGDVIFKVGDTEVPYLVDNERPAMTFIDHVQKAETAPMTVTVLRDGKPVTVTLHAKPNPEFDPAKDYGEIKPPSYLIGIALNMEESREGIGFFSAIGHAVSYPVRQTDQIITQLISWGKGETEGNLVSVVGITAEVKRRIDRGWIYLLEMLMMLNVYLGLFNLFPLPALDGGRLVFLGYEMITRRRANPKIETNVHMVGILALMLLLVVVTYNDCAREFSGCF